MYMLITPQGQVYFLADTTVNIEPTAEDLAEIAMHGGRHVRDASTSSRAWPCSPSRTSARTRHPLADKVRRAAELVTRSGAPDLMIDGEMQADTAVVPEILDRPIRSAR